MGRLGLGAGFGVVNRRHLYKRGAFFQGGPTILRHWNQTAGSRTGRPVPEQENVLDQDGTYINV